MNWIKPSDEMPTRKNLERTIPVLICIEHFGIPDICSGHYSYEEERWVMIMPGDNEFNFPKEDADAVKVTYWSDDYDYPKQYYDPEAVYKKIQEWAKDKG